MCSLKKLVLLENVSKGFLAEKVLLFRFSLKVVSATFLLFCFICLKERTYETRKNVSYFTLKALYVLEIIKF